MSLWKLRRRRNKKKKSSKLRYVNGGHIASPNEQQLHHHHHHGYQHGAPHGHAAQDPSWTQQAQVSDLRQCRSLQVNSLLLSIHFPPFLRCFQNPRILCYPCCFLGLRLEWTLIRFCLCSLFGMFNWFLETGFSLLQAFLFFLLFSENKIRPDTIFFFFFTTFFHYLLWLLQHINKSQIWNISQMRGRWEQIKVTWIHFYYAPNHNKPLKIVASQDLLN